MVKVNSKSQKGRSMVEMLGVLAVIGVLSVGGVYGYGVAMKKHKANELLHQASMLATTVSAQAMTNNGTLPSTIIDFGSTNYGSFSKTVTEKGNQFVLTIEGLDESVCEQLKKGGIIQSVQCVDSEASGKKDAQISYYKNLATNEKDGYAGGAYGPQVDKNGCYEVSYRTGECCDIDKTVKVCPGDTKPNTNCIPSPPEGCSCDNKPQDGGDAWYCEGDDYWYCLTMQLCEGGPNKGKCMSTCGCDEAEKPTNGDSWHCIPSWGTWHCDAGTICTGGKNKGNCMSYCECDNKPDDGDAWQCTTDGNWVCHANECSHGLDKGKCMSSCDCGAEKEGEWNCNTNTGEWECWYTLCSNGDNAGKCMRNCGCDASQKPTNGDGWNCNEGMGEWMCYGYHCETGLDEGKCMYECRCSEGCSNCSIYNGECLD